jgi:hypothetical protein
MALVLTVEVLTAMTKPSVARYLVAHLHKKQRLI